MPRHDTKPNIEPDANPGATGFDDGVDESALLDLISGIESRLGDLKATQHLAATHAPHDVPDDTPPAEISEPADIRERVRRLGDRERDLSSREQVLVAQTERIDEECKLLEQARAQIAAQRDTQRQRAEDLARDRDTLDERAKDLESREKSLAEQREVTQATSAYAEAERAKIAQAQSELATREKDAAERTMSLDERAATLDAQGAELVALRERLAEQQSGLESEAKQYAQLQVEMAALFERLSEAEQAASAHARSGDATPELDEHWRSLESECTRLKRELSTTRKTLREVEQDSKSRAKAGDPPPKRTPAIERTPHAVWVFTASWLISAALLALGVLVALTSASPAPAAILLGPAFTVSLVCAAYVARKLLSPAVIALALVAATFGLWAPAWVEGLRETLYLWNLPLEPLPQITHHLVPLAVAAAACSLAMTWALYLTTNSAKVLGALLLATLAIVPILLAPIGEPIPTVIAALVWHAMTAGALTRWALGAAQPDANATPPPPPLSHRPGLV